MSDIINLFMESSKLVGESAMFVHQEAEPSLLLQQSLLTAICNKLLHVHLAVGEGLQTLQRRKKDKAYRLSHKSAVLFFLSFIENKQLRGTKMN